MVENLGSTQVTEVSEMDRKANLFAKVISSGYFLLKESDPDKAQKLGFIDALRVAKTTFVSRQYNNETGYEKSVAKEMRRKVEDTS